MQWLKENGEVMSKNSFIPPKNKPSTKSGYKHKWYANSKDKHYYLEKTTREMGVD